MKARQILSLVIILSISLLACKQNPGKTEPTKAKEEVKMMVGDITLNDFSISPYKEWYNDEISSYLIDSNTLSTVKQDFSSIEVLVYFGSWCSDSRREVPRFIKIMDKLNFKTKNLKFIGLDREKSAPNYKENIWDIQFVPTFIFLKNGKEIGRIIETPKETLESDIFNILTKG